MTDFETLKQQADTLGLEGEAAAQYIVQEQNRLRDERQAERELAKEENMRRLEELKQRNEKAEREQNFELEKRKLELEHEREMARIAQTNSTGQPPNFTTEISVARPKLPEYKDPEDISTYIIRFERVAELLSIPRAQWAVRMGTQLTGKAADIYTSLSSEITADYDLLRKSLLHGFSKTPDKYRLEFRNARVAPTETFTQFSIGLGRKLDLWIESSDVEHTYEALRKFILLDQFKSSLSTELRTFVKEQNCTTLNDAVRCADNFASAHNSYPRANIPANANRRPPYKPTNVITAATPPAATPTSPTPPAPASPTETAGAVTTRPPLRCFTCGVTGHHRNRCPTNPSINRSGVHNVNIPTKDPLLEYCVSGTVNGAWVNTILRDSGAGYVLVAEDVLPDVDVTKCPMKELACYLGRKDKFPLVRCYIKCPFYEGWVDAARAPIKYASVIIGNIEGVKNPFVSPSTETVLPSSTDTLDLPATYPTPALAPPTADPMSQSLPDPDPVPVPDLDPDPTQTPDPLCSPDQNLVLDISNATIIEFSSQADQIAPNNINNCSVLECDTSTVHTADGDPDAAADPVETAAIAVPEVASEGAEESHGTVGTLHHSISSQSTAHLTPSDDAPPINAVQTRASSKPKRVHPLVVPSMPTLDLTPAQFADKQRDCKSLDCIRRKIESNEIENTREGSQYRYEIVNNLMYRTCIDSKFKERIGNKSLVVPYDCRQLILAVGHESPMAGHYSQRKTIEKIRDIFYWPSIGRDISDYCRSCDICQRMSAKGRVKPAPLVTMPIVTEPFSKCAIDIVGPINPSSSSGHKYILTLIDYATGYPEAVALKEIDSITIAEALVEIFSRVGIPREILSDRGSNFTSKLMGEVHRLLSVKPLFSSPYHPICNGRVERLHSTLKSCLRKLCASKPKDWNRYLPPTLFAIREMPSDRTGFSPFELLYGRTVRGPLAVLRDLWADTTINDEQRTIYQYVIDLRNKLEETAEIAATNAAESAKKYKTYYDIKSQNRKFQVGDEVLVLLPDKVNKLLIAWSGPFTIIECRDKVNYVIDDNGTNKLFHVNMLKKYHRRTPTPSSGIDEEVHVILNIIHPFQAVALECDDAQTSCCLSLSSEVPAVDCVTPSPAVVDYYTTSVVATAVDCGDGEVFDIDSKVEFPVTCDGKVELDRHDIDINPSLEPEQHNDLRTLFQEFDSVFSEKPGFTDLLQHDIILTSTEQVKSRIYPIPLHLQKDFEAEVDQLLDLGIIRPSTSPYTSPPLMVPKKNGTHRLAIDYRGINSQGRPKPIGGPGRS